MAGKFKQNLSKLGKNVKTIGTKSPEEQKKELLEFNQKWGKVLTDWQIDNGVIIKPVMIYQATGIVPDMTLLPMSKSEQENLIKARGEEDAKNG